MKTILSLVAGIALFNLQGKLEARTITLTADDCDQMAALTPIAPRLSWGLSQQTPGVFFGQPQLYFVNNLALLLRFPVADLIPKGQRITKAEFTITPNYVAANPTVRVRRVLAEWGPGVCHQYRMTYPKKVEWAQPGGRGAAVDRSDKDSAVFKMSKVGEHTADVTEDIELWYTGAANNRGWILTLDEGVVYLPTPYSLPGTTGKQWKLQITFEPQ